MSRTATWSPSYPCCNEIEQYDGTAAPCEGLMAIRTPGALEYICDLCKARCGRMVHPECETKSPSIVEEEHRERISYITKKREHVRSDLRKTGFKLESASIDSDGAGDYTEMYSGHLGEVVIYWKSKADAIAERTEASGDPGLKRKAAWLDGHHFARPGTTVHASGVQYCNECGNRIKWIEVPARVGVITPTQVARHA